MLRELLAHLPRSQKLVLAMIVDAMLIALSVWGAFALRLADLWPEMLASRWWLLLAMPAVTLPVFHLVRLYRGVIRHLGTQFTLAL
ncbi:MAG: polysaccharide biosynthesis protein, partial [Planctomycetota bacterium]|nr:polysaccharide biosynthesis protein [Planctomycetota bacterium]